MSTKEQLHRLIDNLPEREYAAALRYLQFLVSDPFLRLLLSAPDDDEPDMGEADEALAELERGEGIPFEQVKRELGL